MQINRNSLAALLLGLAVPLIASAQTSDAVLVGIISDASGASAAGATISAVNSATGVSREVVTNETGAYRLGPLVPGTYTVTA
ncbi:MAG: carboxypeptidase-like regulatory domain-containing protein, partial [Acidobacteriota bacterium]